MRIWGRLRWKNAQTTKIERVSVSFLSFRKIQPPRHAKPKGRVTDLNKSVEHSRVLCGFGAAWGEKMPKQPNLNECQSVFSHSKRSKSSPEWNHCSWHIKKKKLNQWDLCADLAGSVNFLNPNKAYWRISLACTSGRKKRKVGRPKNSWTSIDPCSWHIKFYRLNRWSR